MTDLEKEAGLFGDYIPKSQPVLRDAAAMLLKGFRNSVDSMGPIKTSKVKNKFWNRAFKILKGKDERRLARKLYLNPDALPAAIAGNFIPAKGAVEASVLTYLRNKKSIKNSLAKKAKSASSRASTSPLRTEKLSSLDKIYQDSMTDLEKEAGLFGDIIPKSQPKLRNAAAALVRGFRNGVDAIDVELVKRDKFKNPVGKWGMRFLEFPGRGAKKVARKVYLNPDALVPAAAVGWIPIPGITDAAVLSYLGAKKAVKKAVTNALAKKSLANKAKGSLSSASALKIEKLSSLDKIYQDSFNSELEKIANVYIEHNQNR